MCYATLDLSGPTGRSSTPSARCDPGGRSLPRRQARQRAARRVSAAGPERDLGHRGRKSRPALSLPTPAHQGRRAPRRQRIGPELLGLLEAETRRARWRRRPADAERSRPRAVQPRPTRHSPSSKNDSVEHAGFGHDQPRVCQVRWSARPKNGLALSSLTKRRPAGTAGYEHDRTERPAPGHVSITTGRPAGSSSSDNTCTFGMPSSGQVHLVFALLHGVIPARPTHLS